MTPIYFLKQDEGQIQHHQIYFFECNHLTSNVVILVAVIMTLDNFLSLPPFHNNFQYPLSNLWTEKINKINFQTKMKIVVNLGLAIYFLYFL
jgi:hypothetical protein